ncbi:membrane protein insertase YidC [Candidatus Dojkabacteria bacterium]|nr:membrane protein insertase YidC [Candidatus Dojkabacteria bacterium]
MGEVIKTIWNTVLYYPFLNFLFVLYHLLGDNLGLAVIAIGILSRLALIPIAKKQMESTQVLTKLRPEIEKLQKKYANNQEKLAKEQIKLYRKFNYNPIGCFGTFFIQIIILLIVVGVIRNISSSEFITNFTGIYDFVKAWVVNGNENFAVNTNFLGMQLDQNYTELIDKCNCIPLKDTLLNIPYTILSITIGVLKVPSALNYWLLGISVAAVQLVASNFMKHFQGMDTGKKSKKTKKKDPEEMTQEEIQQEAAQSMTKILPIMTFVITLGYPAVLGVYWLAQSVMTFVQYFIIDKEKTVDYFKEAYSDLRDKFPFLPSRERKKESPTKDSDSKSSKKSKSKKKDSK